MKKSEVLLSCLFFLIACLLSRAVSEFIDVPIAEIKIIFFYLCILGIYMMIKSVYRKKKINN